MSEGLGEIKGDDFNRGLVRALGHPVRVRILQALAKEEARAGQLGALTGEPPAKVDYHLRILLDCGCIEVIRAAGGADEPVYRAKPQAAVSLRSWDKVPGSLRVEIAAALLEKLSGDAVGALKEVTGPREDSNVMRLEMVLDQKGWRDLRDIFNDPDGPIRRVAASSAERLRAGEGTPIEVVTAAFETDAEDQPE